MQHAHLFPELDINALNNLNAVADPVHRSISRVWTEFDRRAGAQVKSEQVRQMSEAVDRHFKHWYNQFFEESKVSMETLSKVEQAALLDVEQLVLRVRAYGE